jgi:hypothetical protein
MSVREDLAEEHGEDLLFLDEEFFDKAIVGVVHQFNNTVVCYNTIGAYVGEKTPAFLELL